nr:efflux RND transporter periplasmic adaptor subunit [uncultured Celeribacter sp.]
MQTKKVTALAVLAIAAAAGYLVWTVQKPETYLVQGEVEATRIDLSAMVTARVSDTPVDFGDRVETGQTVVQLDSPLVRAALANAEAAVAVAAANRDLAYATRPENIATAQAQLLAAKADVALAQKTFERISQLRDTSVVSDANLDQARNSRDAALQAQFAAEANLDLARNGASDEQKAVAVAQLKQAEAARTQAQANVDEMTVIAPINGEVTARMAEPGKLFNAGAPLISIVDVDHAWFTFNLREDLLQGLEVGAALEVRVPALGEDRDPVPAQITAINVEGSYANWRATKATGDFDLRTFSVRAEPTDPVEGLRPGMSALVDWPTAPNRGR